MLNNKNSKNPINILSFFNYVYHPVKELGLNLKRLIYNYLYYGEDEYGHQEPRIERSVFKFWIYPSYWNFLLKKYFKKTTLFQHSENNSKKKSLQYLTYIIPHNAGIGHQLACWNTALILSIKYNLKFIHYPLSGSWESFLGLGEEELNYFDIDKNQNIRIVDLPRIRRIDEKDKIGHRIFNEIINSECSNNSNILFRLNPDHFAYDQTSTTEILRSKYWKAREKCPIDLFFRQDRLNIACHVRRGDILRMNSKSKEFNNRYLGNDYFINIIERIKTVLVNCNIDVHIFSQGNIEDFSDFKELDHFIYHLNEDVLTTFHGMVVADILILSPSSFSYKAGIISKGIKVAKYPWWHEIPENSEWIRSNENGEFNTHPLTRYSKSSIQL